MDPRFLEKLRQQFPQMDDLAAARFKGSGSVLADRNHRAKYSEDLTAVVLAFANAQAIEAGLQIKFTKYEKRVLAKHFDFLRTVLVWLTFFALSCSDMFDGDPTIVGCWCTEESSGDRSRF